MGSTWGKTTSPSPIPSSETVKKTGDEKKKLVVVIGGIAAGKTTLVTALRSLLGENACVLEPVDDAKECGLLKAFYSDMKTYATLMQIFMFTNRLRKLKECISNLPDGTKFVVMDGHPMLDRYVFMENLKEIEMMNELGVRIYLSLFKSWQTLVPEAQPTLLIYLDTPPELCMQRIESRDREEEKGITYEYLFGLRTKLESLYHMLEINPESIVSGKMTIARVNGADTKEQVFENVKKILAPLGS